MTTPMTTCLSGGLVRYPEGVVAETPLPRRITYPLPPARPRYRSVDPSLQRADRSSPSRWTRAFRIGGTARWHLANCASLRGGEAPDTRSDRFVERH